MNSPPSTLMMSPLMKSVPGPDSATMAFATSCGVVIRPVGLRFDREVDHLLRFGDLEERGGHRHAGADRVDR